MTFERPTPMHSTGETAPVHNTGAVNFDSNLVTAAEVSAAARVEAQPGIDSISFGAKTLGQPLDTGTAVVAEPVVEAPRRRANFLSMSVDLTLSTGLDFLQNQKLLRTVEIQHQATGVTESYNFYNPFLRSDAERNTSEGLLRAVFGRLMQIANAYLARPGYAFDPAEIRDGRLAANLGHAADLDLYVEDLRYVLTEKMANLFPTKPSTELFKVPVTAGGATYPRPVRFHELFNVTSWLTKAEDDNLHAAEYHLSFNIQMNLGALYDAKERHVFVGKALSFLKAQLKACGLAHVVGHNVNYAFDSETLANSGEAIDAMAHLLDTAGYTLVSRHAVDSGKHADWAPCSNSALLFGYGCDLILRSPNVEFGGPAE